MTQVSHSEETFLNVNIETFEIWKGGKMIEEDFLVYNLFKTQEVIEFKARDSKESINLLVGGQPMLTGYLWKRDPRGLIKGWKKRWFVLEVKFFLLKFVEIS